MIISIIPCDIGSEEIEFVPCSSHSQSIIVIDVIMIFAIYTGGTISMQFLFSKTFTFKSLQTSNDHHATRRLF